MGVFSKYSCSPFVYLLLRMLSLDPFIHVELIICCDTWVPLIIYILVRYICRYFSVLSLVSIFNFFFFISTSDLLSAGPLPKWLQRLKLHEAKAKSQELHWASHRRGRAQASTWHPLLLSWLHWQEAGAEVEQLRLDSCPYKMPVLQVYHNTGPCYMPGMNWLH